MKACGITAEYNPFHRGHAYQIAQTRKALGEDTVLVAVMSGSWVQRGEPAIIDKWQRAETACRSGIDLVLELPYFYATQSAGPFAHGAVSILKLAGVEAISFGSECGNLENLQEIADTPINPDHLHQSMNRGMSFPKAYSLLTTEMQPNDILAVSYLREIAGTGIRPILIPRTTNYLDPELHETASALAIRTALAEGRDLGDTTVMKDALLASFHPWPELYYPYLRTFLLTSDPAELAGCFLFAEGIENHLIAQAKRSSDYEEFLRNAVSWRYTAGRIRRTCLAAMNRVTKAEVQKLPPLDTPRILAFNERGRAYLHQQKDSGVRFASRFASVPWPWRKMEYRAALMYASVFPEPLRTQLLEREIGGALYVDC